MRILLLTHSFNSLTQRLFCVLREAGHTVSVELDIADSVTQEAVDLFAPDVVIAPFLKRRIPQSIWSRVLCLIVHPGVPGDKGPSALDWMLMRGDTRWGVTVLQAQDDFDAGPVWTWQAFEVRAGATKSSIYRREVTDAAVQAVHSSIKIAMESGAACAQSMRAAVDFDGEFGDWNPPIRQENRRIDWSADSTATVLRKMAASDGSPGVLDALFDQPCHLFDAHPASAALVQQFANAPAGGVLARRGPALLRRTADGAVWIGHVRLNRPDNTLKLPATLVFSAQAATLLEANVALMRPDDEWDELHYAEHGPEGARVGWLDFDFHNGAMSTRQCVRLKEALQWIRTRPTQVLVLAGGHDFFSNGIHLHDIEAAQTVAGDSAADASWRNINAMNDAALEILTLTDRITIAALRGNAGAGGCFLALAADRVWAHAGVILNPHYKNMGNLYGSEYWTYSLPRRVGAAAAQALMQERLPLSAAQALERGLLDSVGQAQSTDFSDWVLTEALQLAASAALPELLAHKQEQRLRDEATKPLAQYRNEELARMRRNFYGFDASYHVARHHFVFRKPHAWTPRHLAAHR